MPTKSAKKKKRKKKPEKRAKRGSSAMSKAADLSRAEVSIMGRMAELDPDTPRYRALEAALAFKSSWIILGEHLANVMTTQLWKGWGYPSFERYAADEVFLSAATAKKLVRSFVWLGNEAPEYLPKIEDGRVALPKRLPTGALPDVNAISVLAEAKRCMDDDTVSEDAYLALKQAAFDGQTAATLKRTLIEAIPEEKKKPSADDKVRHLRRALTASVKVIDELREWNGGGLAADAGGDDGDDLMVAAEKLRDAIALRLPRVEPARQGGADPE